MKRAFISAVLVAAFAFGSVTVGSAADMSGTVQTIQVNDRVLTLSDGTKLYWTDSVEVTDIKEGSKVKATYEPKDGKFVLTKIEVMQ